MPYNKAVQRVIAGSLEYRTRPTEIQDNNAQKLTNFAFDQNQGLRSRKGHELICSASGSVKQIIHAMDHRWAATAAAVDKDCTALIAVPEAHIVGFKKYVWAANGLMRKSDGTHDWKWIPDAPTRPPRIQAQPLVITPIDDFSGGWEEDAEVDGEDESGVTFDFDGSGMIVEGDDNSVFSATKEFAANLYDGFDKDDIFRIQLKSNKWTNIAGVTFEVDVNEGDFSTDYYQAYMPLAQIKGARKETVTFHVRKRPLAPNTAAANQNLWTYFQRIGSTTDKDWRSVVKLRVKVEFIKAARLWFTKWEMIGDKDNTLEGDDFGVYYTYTTKDGHESNPSPKSKLITVFHGSIRVWKLRVTDDPQVVGVNVYLTGGNLGAVYRVNGAAKQDDESDPDDPPAGDDDGEDPVPFGEYIIIQSLDDLTDFNVQMEEDHDTPPEAEGIAGPYYGRILAWKGNRFYWTHQNKPYAFANPDGPDGDWAELDENAGKIKHISVRYNEAWIYAENEIFVLNGDPGDSGGEVHPTGLRMGTPSRNGVAQAGPADIAYLTSGIYVTDGSGTARKISEQLEPIFQGRSVLLWDGTLVEPIGDPSSVCVGYEDGIVRFSHSEGTYTYAIAINRWVGDSRLFTCFAPEGEQGILGGQSDGSILKLETGFTDNGEAIPLEYMSKAYDFGIQDNEKRVEDVTVYSDLAGEAFTLKVWYAENLNLSTSISTFGRERTVFQLADADGIRARNFAVSLTGDVHFEIFIDAIDFNYYAEAREGKSYDTAVTDAGTSKVKLIREVQVDLENAAAVEVRLKTDVARLGLFSSEPALTVKDTHTIPLSGFRRTRSLVMTEECYGHDIQVVASTPGFFHIFGVRALVQAIGHFLHGEQGEYYLSDAVDWGTERVKLAREIEVVYRSAGEATVTLATDLPDALTTRATFVLPRTFGQGERTIKLRLSGLISGRLYQLRIAPVMDFRLESLRMRIKMIGEPNATAWTWIEFPLTPTQDGIWVDLPAWQQDQVA